MNDTKAGRFYAPPMTFTSNQKEHTMKASFILRFVQLSLLAGTVTTLAATCGYTRASDERLKQEIRPVEGALVKLRQIS